MSEFRDKQVKYYEIYPIRGSTSLKGFDLKNELTPGYFQNRDIIFPEKKDSLVKLVNSLEETDEYVLMIVRLK